MLHRGNYIVSVFTPMLVRELLSWQISDVWIVSLGSSDLWALHLLLLHSCCMQSLRIPVLQQEHFTLMQLVLKRCTVDAANNNYSCTRWGCCRHIRSTLRKIHSNFLLNLMGAFADESRHLEAPGSTVFKGLLYGAVDGLWTAGTIV
jgi:hypothetical protein